MNLELVIREAVADAITRELTPLLAPFISKLNISDKGVEEEFLTAPEAAKILKVSPITMSIWRHEKRGPDFVRLGNGRGVRYKRSTLLAFIERNGSLIGKRGRPPKAEVIKTSGKTTGRVKKSAATPKAVNS